MIQWAGTCNGKDVTMKKVFASALLMCLVCSSLMFSSSADNSPVEQFNELANSILVMDADVSSEEIDSLLSQLEGLDLAGEEDQNELTGSMVGGQGQSIQQLFAQLQLELAQQSKEQALEKISAIQASQERSAQVTEYLNTARQLYAKATGSAIQLVPQDMLRFLQSNSLYIPKDPASPSAADWQAIIQSLEDFQDRISTDVQSQMVHIQDYMGQYNSYVSQSSAILNSDAMKGLSGSATMLGMGGAGMAVTALVIGAAAGSLVTALVLGRKRRKG